MPERDLRNLPPEVLARLADNGADLRTANLEVSQRGRILEARSFASGEIRLDDAGLPVLDGYATVYEHGYDVAGGAPYGWVETIAEGACMKSVMERDDVRLLLNHEGVPLGRTRSKTLELESDATGLRCSSTLDPMSPLVATIRSAMDRGDLDEMSFAFRVLRQEWNADYTERRILEVKLFDVSVVTYPANDQTMALIGADADRPVVVAPAVRGLGVDLARAEWYRLAG